MTNDNLAQSYLEKASKRAKVLALLRREKAYSDVVREAQEIVELSLKGMLRQVGIEPPKWHDVGPLITANRERLPKIVARSAGRLADISRWLRLEREAAFYGDVDFIPTEEYDGRDAARAIRDATFVLKMAARVIPPKSRPPRP